MKRLVALLSPRRLLAASIIVALLTMALKLLAWHITGSMGLFSDALEGFVNLAGAVFALFMVTIAARPPDAGHPFGHAKAEYFSSGFEGILIIGAALLIMWHAIPRLYAPLPLQSLGAGLIFSVLSALLNAALAWLMLIVGKRSHSIALHADAHHLLTDVLTTAGVVIGIAIAGLSGWLWLDAAVAIAVALHILTTGGRLVWTSVQGLMDEALEPEFLLGIESILLRHTTPDVYFDHLRTRRAGHSRFADLHMHVPANWPLGHAAQLRLELMHALTQAVPGLVPTIELLPEERTAAP